MTDPTDPTTAAGAEPQAEPVCPRHPRRVAYVRCQRCERPVCPECQRPAAVGIQCVDCVRQAAAATPRIRTAFGGAVVSGPPMVTIGLIAACVVLFVAQQAIPSLTEHWEFSPYAARARPWTFLTSAFLHSPTQVLHIASNMYALWICGQHLERVLGRARFLALYLVSALGGSVGYLLLASPTLPAQGASNAWWGGTVGASGAVFGLFAALVVFNRKMGISTVPIFALIAINAVLGFVVSGIAWQAHAGGLVTGALASAVLVFAPRARRAQVQWAGLGAVLVLLLVLTLVKFATVPADVTEYATALLQSG